MYDSLVVGRAAFTGLSGFAVGRRFSAWIFVPASKQKIHTYPEIDELGAIGPYHTGGTIPGIEHRNMIAHKIELYPIAPHDNAEAQLIIPVIHNRITDGAMKVGRETVIGSQGQGKMWPR